MRNRGGFSMIEMIGVLAIIAIIISAIVPNVAKEISRAIADSEDASIKSILKSIEVSVLDRRIIPSTAVGGWNNDIALYLSCPANQIVENKGSGTRRLVVRPTNGLGTLPYDQTARFSATVNPQGTLPVSSPLQARFMIISNLDGIAPVTNLTDLQFDAVWDQTGVIPVGFTENEKCRIGRISIASLFNQVTVHCDSINSLPQWSLDNATTPKTLNPNTTFTVYLLTGTRINLFQNGVSSGTVVVNGPLGIVYNGISWRF